MYFLAPNLRSRRTPVAQTAASDDTASLCGFRRRARSTASLFGACSSLLPSGSASGCCSVLFSCMGSSCSDVRIFRKAVSSVLRVASAADSAFGCQVLLFLHLCCLLSRTWAVVFFAGSSTACRTAGTCDGTGSGRARATLCRGRRCTESSRSRSRRNHLHHHLHRSPPGHSHRRTEGSGADELASVCSDVQQAVSLPEARNRRHRTVGRTAAWMSSVWLWVERNYELAAESFSGWDVAGLSMEPGPVLARSHHHQGTERARGLHLRAFLISFLVSVDPV